MERIGSAVAAEGGNAWAAVEDFKAMLTAEPEQSSLSSEQKELRRALGVA